MATKRMVFTGLVGDRRVRRLLSDSTRLLFFYLYLGCDDDGKMYGDPIDIKANMFPINDKVQVKNIKGMMLDLAKNGLIKYYECIKSKEIMIEVLGWKEVNRIPPDRYNPSLIPCFDDVHHKLLIEAIVPEGKVVKTGKKKYLDKVLLTDVEYERLTREKFCGDVKLTDIAIDMLNTYKMASGKSYKSDYHAILSWVIERMKDDAKLIAKKKKHKNIIEWAG